MPGMDANGSCCLQTAHLRANSSTAAKGFGDRE